MRRTLVMALALVTLATGCRQRDKPVPASAGSPTGSPVATVQPSLPATLPVTPSTPAFQSTIVRVPAAMVSGKTWHPGCPVPISDLRLLTLSYWGFDGQVHQGPMIVNASVADDLVWVFRRLFHSRFPIGDLTLAAPFD